MTRKRTASCITCLIACLLSLLLAACAGHRSGVVKTGFLKDYSILEPGTGASLFYWNPDVDRSKYDKVVIEPVTVWTKKGSKIDLPREDIERLCKYLDNSVRKEISKVKQIVKVSGPDTARLRLAITEAVDANVSMNLLTSIHPGVIVVGETYALASGTRLFVGSASIEGELVDSMTGELLMAGVDKRQGGKDFSIGDWSHVEDAFDFWAKDIVERMQARVKQASAE